MVLSFILLLFLAILENTAVDKFLQKIKLRITSPFSFILNERENR